eukprot:CAMPEP_0119131648 /NCGR_PEP_ID=MMETSP1310-20130426/10499_1 /TAXON_ID=464262 /ORGANISM="Genus nov. species nov., Strain RCC2339" /LENGTH=845 /DNA_ID=CAMNT_0007122235 /DNA_START=165 /DNA_END=2702 /DNA_ORIENTATION=-
MIATHDVVTQQSGAVYIGTVNAGVWKTTNVAANGYFPHWEPISDDPALRCSSISALTVEDDLVIAGCGGSTSSEMGKDWNSLNNEDWGGIFYSRDGGATWVQTDMAQNEFVTGIVVVPASVSPTGQERWIVGFRSHFFHPNVGGVYMTDDSGVSWTKVVGRPVFAVQHADWELHHTTGATPIYAAVAQEQNDVVLRSLDYGKSWDVYGQGIVFPGDFVPFYIDLDVGNMADGPVVMYAALTVSLSNSSDTNSASYYRDTRLTGSTWTAIANAPNLEDDRMPKDRCAVLHDPELDGLSYFAGNGGRVVYRVNYTEGVWTKMWNQDTSDGSEPHVDCRNLAWLHGELILVSDGGIFRRTNPREAGSGTWTSLAGDATPIELYNAAYDERNDRWTGSAQDNSVIISEPAATPSDVGLGVVGGDGTHVDVDNMHCPARLYGCAQYLGGLSYRVNVGSEMMSSRVPFGHYFPDISGYPFFLTWYQVNRLNPDQLLFAVNSTQLYAGGLWEFNPAPDPSQLTSRITGDPKSWNPDLVVRATIKYGTTDLRKLLSLVERQNSVAEEDGELVSAIKHLIPYNKDWPEPQLVAGITDEVLAVHVAGSHVLQNGELVPDADRVVGMSYDNYYSRSGASPAWSVTPLPQKFAPTVDWYEYYNDNRSVVIGPVSHGKTVSMALSLLNSSLVAVTGWPYDDSGNMNLGDEHVWLTTDDGATWLDVTSNLLTATAALAKSRPAGLEFVDEVDDAGTTALLVGTINGVFVSFFNQDPSTITWSRLGTCAEFPLVVVTSINYEAYSDTLVVSTFGRGVYTIANAKAALYTAMSRQLANSCTVPAPPPLSSNSRLLPTQQQC